MEKKDIRHSSLSREETRRTSQLLVFSSLSPTCGRIHSRRENRLKLKVSNFYTSSGTLFYEIIFHLNYKKNKTKSRTLMVCIMIRNDSSCGRTNTMHALGKLRRRRRRTFKKKSKRPSSQTATWFTYVYYYLFAFHLSNSNSTSTYTDIRRRVLSI